MGKIFILTPRDLRSAFFFWLGVGIFPVFWSWFTVGKNFPKWQRHLALGWMVVSAAIFALTWPRMAEHYGLLLLGLPLLSLLVTFGLCAWLAVRELSLVSWFYIYIVAGGVAHILFDRLVAHAVEQDFSWKWAVLPLAPALLHLLTSASKMEQPPSEEDPGSSKQP